MDGRCSPPAGRWKWHGRRMLPITSRWQRKQHGGCRGPQQAEWLERLEREHDNLRATLAWSLEAAQAGPHLEMAFRLGEALEEFWNVRGFYSEGRAFLEQALARSEGVAASVRAKALSSAAGFTDQRVTLIGQRHCTRRVSSCTASLGTPEELRCPSRGLAGIAQNKGTTIAVAGPLLRREPGALQGGGRQGKHRPVALGI